MSTAAEQYRALVSRLESINEAPLDPRSQAERESQMAAVKGAFQDYEAAEKAAAAKPAVPAKPAADPKVGELVKKLQTVLNTKGAQLTVDGVMGVKTIEAVIKALETPPQAAQPTQPTTQPAPQPAAPALDQGSLSPWAKGGLFNR